LSETIQKRGGEKGKNVNEKRGKIHGKRKVKGKNKRKNEDI
jgi:hypothetical protein